MVLHHLPTTVVLRLQNTTPRHGNTVLALTALVVLGIIQTKHRMRRIANKSHPITLATLAKDTNKSVRGHLVAQNITCRTWVIIPRLLLVEANDEVR